MEMGYVDILVIEIRRRKLHNFLSLTKSERLDAANVIDIFEHF